MLYRYAAYSKKHSTIHYSILLCLFIVFFGHITLLLEEENIWLFLGIFIYIPILACWCKISTLRDRMTD